MGGSGGEEVRASRPVERRSMAASWARSRAKAERGTAADSTEATRVKMRSVTPTSYTPAICQ